MTIREIRQFLSKHGLVADIYKSGDSVHIDLEDNVFADLILETLTNAGYVVYRENPRYLPDLFTVDSQKEKLS